jgi:hypothetical protein
MSKYNEQQQLLNGNRLEILVQGNDKTSFDLVGYLSNFFSSVGLKSN